MRIGSTLKIARRALARNLTRAFLTMLGIIIGVSAVIAMMEIGQGSSSTIQRTIASMGANNLMIQPGQAASGGISFGGGSQMTLTPDDYEAVAKDCPAIRAAAPTTRGPRGQVVYGNQNWVPGNITGTTPSYLDVRDWGVEPEGRMFTDREVKSQSKVCVIGQTIRTQLFAGESPLEKEIRIQGVPFKVVGVLTRKGASMMGSDQDDVILAPWTTMKQRVSNQSSAATSGGGGSTSTGTTGNAVGQPYPQSKPQLYPAISETQAANQPLPVRFNYIDNIMAAAASTPEIPDAIEQIKGLLREKHRLRADEPDDFNVRDMTEMSNSLKETTEVMTQLLLFVAAISLIVGGVGIMNIMLVSVTERTREIGLRMAVGARAHEILQQFLVEAVVLCLAGGAIGVMLGRGASLLVTRYKHWPTESSPAAVIAALAVSATVGIVFGWYPAWKASRLDPIEALRYE